MNMLEVLFKECLRLVSWDINVEWVKEGEWFKIRNMVKGRRCYDSVMFDFKIRRSGELVGFGNFGYDGIMDFGRFKFKVLEEEGVVRFVSGLFRYYD